MLHRMTMSILGGPELPPDDFSLDRHPGRGSLIPPIFDQTAKTIRIRVPPGNSKDMGPFALNLAPNFEAFRY